MAKKKIIRNESGDTYQIINRDIANGSSYDIEPNFWLEAANATTLHSSVLSEDLIVNDGTNDLPPTVGVAHLTNINGIERSHTDITLLPAAGEQAASFIEVGDLIAGHSMAIDEKIYGQSRVDNFAGGDIKVQLHCIIDNNVADRWIQFELKIRSTTGDLDKTLNTADTTIVIGPEEVPTTPFMPFEVTATVSSTYFENNEKYLLFQAKRVTATGKTAPINDPIIWRYCKIYYKVIN